MKLFKSELFQCDLQLNTHQMLQIIITLAKSSQFDELMGSVVTDYDDEDVDHYEEVDQINAKVKSS